MESQARTSSDSLNTLTAMHAEPWEYDFFQALRRIECLSPQLPRFGHSVRLADDPLRLGQQADCSFAPATLASVTPCLLYTSPSPRDRQKSRMPSSA